MPRSGPNGTYTLPGAQDEAQPNTTIQSSINNQGWADIEQTFNTPQPVAYGGTGATDAPTALTNLGAAAEASVVRHDVAQALGATAQGRARANINALGPNETADRAFRRGNILGAVSQSGGVPTGAIIERGSNANGEYVLWADGTAIAWNTLIVNTVVAAGGAVSVPPYTTPIVMLGDARVTELVFYVGADATGGPLFTSRQGIYGSGSGSFINTGRPIASATPSFTTLGSTAAASYRLTWLSIGRRF